MGVSCITEAPVLSAFLDQAQEWFPNKTRHQLANLLGMWFEYKGLIPDIEQYAKVYEAEDTDLTPQLQQGLPRNKAAFMSFMGIAKKLSKSKASRSLSEYALLHKREAMIHAFTSTQRLDNVGMIGRDFHDYITKHKPSDKTRSDYIKSIGGVAGVFNQIKARYTRMSNLEWWKTQYERKNTFADLSDAAQQKLLDKWATLAKEYKKIMEHFDALSMDALSSIQKLEEIEADYYGTSLEEAIERRNEDEEETYGENNVNGESYNMDYRTRNNQDTLSVVADRVLLNIPLIDDDGKQVYNYIGYKRYVDPLRVHGVLAETTSLATSSEHLMEILEEEAQTTPWVQSLVRVLTGDGAAQTAIYDNYKRATTRYETVFNQGQNKPLQIGQQNSSSKVNAALRRLSSTMLSGIVLQKGTSIYDGNGELISDEAKLSQIDELFGKVKKLRQSSVKYINKKEALSKREAWLLEHPDAIDTMVRAIRSLGFEVSRKNIERLVRGTDFTQNEKKRFKNYGGDFAVLKQLEKVYGDFLQSIKLNHTPEDFVGYHSRDLRTLSSMLGVVAYDDVETRALVDGKSYMTHTVPNLLHQVADELVGRAQEKDAIGDNFQQYIWEKFGKYEGFHITRTQAEIELEIEERLNGPDADLIKIPIGYEDNPRAIQEARQIAHDTLLREYEDSLTRGSRPIGWIAETYQDADQAGLFQVLDILQLQLNVKKEPGKWDLMDRLKVDWALFWRQSGSGRNAAYACPIESDYNTYNAITGKVYNADIATRGATGELVYDTTNELVKLFVDEVKAEMQRINRIAKTVARGNDPTERIVMSTYEEQGARFHIFPQMNSDGVKEEYDRLVRTPGGGIEADLYLANKVAEYLHNYAQDKIAKYTEAGMFEEKEFKHLTKDGKITDKGQKDLQNFFLNEFYAQYQIAKIFFGGDHFFSNIDEYHKRGMFAHAPRTAIDITAKWNGENVFDKDYYDVAIIEDDGGPSSYTGQIKQIYDDAVASGIITEGQRDQYMKMWDDITTTDGQAFRSLDSFKQICVGFDKSMWTEDHEAAFQALKSGDITPEVMDKIQSLTLAQNIKTVVTGFSEVDTGELEDNGDNVLVRQPFIYKHSEAVMFAPYIAEALKKKMPQYSSPILRALGDFMQREGVDVIEFHSCVKMGDTGVLPIVYEGVSSEQLSAKLSQQYHTIKGAKHSTPYKYYGIAASTPVDYADKNRSFSSQAVKMTWNDIRENDTLTRPDGTIVKSNAAKKQFYQIYAQDIQDAWDTLIEEFKDPRKVEALVQQELASKSYNSKDLKVALSLVQTLDGKGLEFAIPLISPATSRTVQSLLTSVIRNRLGKERTKGGNLIQQTSLGFDEDVYTKYTDEVPVDGWRPLNIALKENTNQLDAVEVYMPIHDERLLRYADETGAISPTRLKELVDGGIIDKRMLEFVAYRTPTDGIHATIPCRIVGFLPRSSGGNIIMPREMMVLTGHDYDVDKMLCHFKDFRVLEWREDKIQEAYDRYKDTEDGKKVSYRTFRRMLLANATDEELKEYQYETPVVQSINYDYTASPENQSKEARNNAEIELIFANITSEAGSRRFFIPGGFEGIKQQAYTTWLLESADPKVQDMLKKISDREKFTTKAELRDFLLKQSSGKLKKVVVSAQAGRSAYDIYERHTSHKEIMDGRDTIAQYALYNSGLAMLQGSGIFIKPLEHKVYKKGKPVLDAAGRQIVETFSLGLCGYTLNALDSIMDLTEGQLQSTTRAQLISAAVDNRNNPILSFLNQNSYTIPLTMTLLAAGVPVNLVFTVMSQPIVKRYAELASKNPFATSTSIFDAIIEVEKDRYNTPTEAHKWASYPQGYKSAVDHLMKREESDLVENLGGDLASRSPMFVKDQLAVAYLLKALSSVSNDLDSLIASLRPENAKNGCGPLLGSTVANRKRVEDLQTKIIEGACSIGFDEVVLSTFIPSIEKGGQKAIETAYEINSHLPMTTLMNSLMLYGGPQLLSKYMVTAIPEYERMTQSIIDLYNQKKVKDSKVLSIQNELILWKLMSDPGLVTEDMKADRQDLVIELPQRVKALKTRLSEVRDLLANPATAVLVSPTEKALVDNKLLQKIWTVRPREDTIPRIQLRLGGNLTETIVQQLRDAWDALMYTQGNIEVEINGKKQTIDIRQMAFELFKYNLYTDGFGFGQYTIAQMAPPSIQMYCPGYIDALRSLSTDRGEWTEPEFERCKVQYIMNHWYDSRLVPRIEQEEWDKMKLEEKDGIVTLKKVLQQTDKSRGIEGAVFDPAKYHWASGFIAYRNNEGKVTLYRIIKELEDGGLVLQEYPKVGSYDDMRQVGLQYEPNTLNPLAIKPLHTGNDSSWGNYSYDADREGNINGENNIEAENPWDNQEKDKSESQLRREQMIRSLQASFAAVNPTRVNSEEINSAVQSSENITKSQPDTLENTEAQTEAAIQENDERQRKINELRAAGKGILFSLVRHTKDANGRPVVQTVQETATPASVRQARYQKANYELNKALREILAKVGVGVGTLYDFEAELGAAGVTDFAMARTVAEGLVEMIRIANNEEGEYALPEEFSHLAMAMLGPNNPLVQRLMNSMTDEVIRDVLGEFYDEYSEMYGGDERRLAFEAAGKLVAKHLLDREPIQQKPYKNILQRVIEAIKNLLRKIGIRDLQYEIAKANDAAQFIADGILEGELADLMIMDNIDETNKYFDIVTSIESNGDHLKEVLKRDIRRYNILKKRVSSKDEDARNAVLDPAAVMVEKMQDAILADKQDIAINDYLQEAMAYIKKCDDSIGKSLTMAEPNNTLCRKLRLDRDLIYSFQDNLKDLRAYAREHPDALSATTIRLLSECQTQLTAFYERYHEAALTQFIGFIKSVMGDEMTIGIGKNKGKKIKAEAIALAADKDISMINRWLDSMADQPDMINKIFDEAVRAYKERVRQMDIDMRVRIDAAFSKYFKATGSRDQGFMFERKNGKKTGRYIDDTTARETLSDAQYTFYKEMMDIKKELDLFLPTVKESHKLDTIKIRKDLLDRIKSSDNIGDSLKSLYAALKDKVLVRSDDEEYLAAQSIVDFEGNKVDSVPLYYRKLNKGETEEDISEDVASTMLAYAHMASNYKELNGIIDILENARSMAQERRVTMRRGRKQEQETITEEKFGSMVTTVHTKAQKEARIGQMLDDFFTMQVYNHMRKDEGSIGNVSIQKGADVINELTSLSTMALNFNQRISNVTVGMVQIMEEAASRQFMHPGTWAKSTAFYIEHLPEMMGQAGAQTNSSFLSMLNEMFDISQENSRRFRDREYRKNAIEKNADTGLLTLGLAWGENLMSMTTGISVLMEYNVLAPDGKTKVPIIKALEVTYADPANKAGARMQLKDGYTKEDGTAFTQQDIYKLTKKIAGINQKLQGIYNTNDKSMIQQYAAGVLVMMFRKWMVPNLRRRYGGANYNFMTETWTEGFYTTLIHFIGTNIKDWSKDLTHLRTVVTTNWDKLTPEEKANMRRAITELGTALGILTSIAVLGRVHLDDDKDGKGFSDWLYKTTLYQLYRLKTEVLAQMPTPTIITEGTKLLAEPFAGMRTLENTADLLKLITEPKHSWKDKIPSGRYKGHTYAYKYLMKAPVISMGRTIGRALDPSDLIEYYKRGGF